MYPSNRFKHSDVMLVSFSVLLFVALIFETLSPVMVVQAATQPIFGTPAKISNDTGLAQDPNVQNVGGNVYVVWTEGSGGIRFRESPDGGVTWAPPLNMPALRISHAGGTTQYPLMSANGTNVYVVWSQTVGSTGLQVMEATSTNSGSSFNSPVQLTSGSPTGGFITPVIASWGNNVYVAYNNNTIKQHADVTCSSNAGGSWTHPVTYSSNHEPQIADWGGKYVYAVADGSVFTSSNYCGRWIKDKITQALGSEPWVGGYGTSAYAAGETKGHGSNILVTASSNNGKTWSMVSNLSITDAWAPIIEAFGNSAWIAVQQFPNGSASQIFVFSTTNGGASWSGPTSLSGKGAKGSDTSFPFTVSTSDGQNVFVAWSQQVSPGYWVMRVASSNNGGSTWSATPSSPPSATLSRNTIGEAGNNNDVARGAISSFGAHCYIAWQYINGASNQIYFAAS